MAIQEAWQGQQPRDNRGGRELQRAHRAAPSGAGRDGMAQALGWFSIGLGLAEVAAPRGIGEMIGIGHHPLLLRLAGLREIASGVAVLAQRRPAGGLWARVAGDAMDFSLLGLALASEKNVRPERAAGAIAAVAGVTILDVLCALTMTRPAAAADRVVRMRKAITVNRPADELYRFWRDFRNLPRIMSHLDSVEPSEGGRSHWRAKAPLGARVEWDAEITEDRANEQIAWRSLPGADVENSGVVRFKRAPGGRGTEVHVELEYRPPGGAVGATLAKLFGREPGQQVQEGLRAFKQEMETGEIARSAASFGQVAHAARPPAGGA